MSLKLIQIVNCRILREHKIIKEDLLIRNGKIINPEKVFFDEKIIADEKIDAKNSIIAPGFIELQINGASGIDFSHNLEKIEEGIDLVAKFLLSTGVTSFCPTIVTSPVSVYHTVLPKIKPRQGDKNGATILGVHVEGPFLSKDKKGAHPENCILEFEEGIETVYKTYGSLENIKIITLAPEGKNALGVIKKLTEGGVTVSVGHSVANLTEGEEAFQNGATFITHLFNAMLPFHHRDPGLVGLLASDQLPPGKTVHFGIISDGVHTHPAALRIAYRTHPDGLVLVTDAISAMGLVEGFHHIGQHKIEITQNKAYIAGTNTLCGSIATMNECIKFLLQATDCGLEYALEAAALHPARGLGIEDKKGTLNFGADADFVMLDDDLNILSTWIAGECVYKKSS